MYSAKSFNWAKGFKQSLVIVYVFKVFGSSELGDYNNSWDKITGFFLIVKVDFIQDPGGKLGVTRLGKKGHFWNYAWKHRI